MRLTKVKIDRLRSDNATCSLIECRAGIFSRYDKEALSIRRFFKTDGGGLVVWST